MSQSNPRPVNQLLRNQTHGAVGCIVATAPGKVILFGEHAINRGQPALAASVGLWARCRICLRSEPGNVFLSGTNQQAVSQKSILDLTRQVDLARSQGNYESIRQLAAEDYFGPAKYILGSALGEQLPDGFSVEWESEIPASSGLGSGGAAFAALVTALNGLLVKPASFEELAAWAYRGDVVAHGGVASALDTQTSLMGGIIRFAGQGLAQAVPCAEGFSLVIGNTGVAASTREMNTRVRHWLEEKPASRLAFFEAMGALSRAALPLLKAGDWNELGRLFNLNQLALEKIGVSSPEIDQLIEAAREAGALGAKLSGSGGGGIVIALVTSETQQRVARAIVEAGGTAMLPEIGERGANVIDRRQI